MTPNFEPVNFDSPRAIQSFLDERGIALKKRWGQNFMINRNARASIIALLAPGPEETVWEVGPGLGAMTVDLAPRSGRLVLFEIDWALIRHLTELFESTESVRIVPGDVIETWPGVAAEAGAPDALFGNLPYSSAGMLLGSLLEQGVVPGRMVFTVQREVASRLVAHPGSADYSSLTALCGVYCSARVAGDLLPGSFYPRPEVVSSIVRLTRRENIGNVDPAIVAGVIRMSFAARRKTVRNNLIANRGRLVGGSVATAEIIDASLSAADIGGTERAERVTSEQFVMLARSLGASVAPGKE